MVIPKFWLYWENKEGSNKSPLISLCHEIMKHHLQKYQITILNTENVQQYVKDIHPHWYNIKCLAHKADYIRAKVLYQEGGMWLDSDIIVLEDFSNLFTLLEKHDFICFEKKVGYPCVTSILANINSELLFKWIKVIEEKLDNKIVFDWQEIGSELLNTLMKSPDAINHNYKYLGIDGSVTVLPISDIKHELFLEDKKVDIYRNDYQPFIILHNSVMDKANSMTRDELLNSKCVLSSFFKLANG
jgi:hypothetical protein